MIANTNDNWMMYFGSSLPQSFRQGVLSSPTQAIPSDTVQVVTNIISDADVIQNPAIEVKIASGLSLIETELKNQTTNQIIQGNMHHAALGTVVSFTNLPSILPTDNYTITTTCKVSAVTNNGLPIDGKTVLSVESTLTGTVNGQIQQSLITQGVENNTSNTSQLLFSNCTSGDLLTSLSDSWNVAWVDYDHDGWEDLYITDKGASLPNKLYRNNGNGTFTKITTGTLPNISALSASSAWADVNNDGWIDVFIVNATGKKSSLYLNAGGGVFNEANNTGIDNQPQYFHGAAWADFNNDGWVDLVITNFFETRFHQFYKNNGNNTFTHIENAVTAESEKALAPILADYDNDGLTDIFIPNGGNKPNSLFKNIGNFQFQKITTGAIATDAFNSVGACWGDYDGDGFVDLFVANASAQNDNLYKNNGNGTFTKINALPTQDNAHSNGANWADMDNDGDLDLLVTNDQGRNSLYINDGAGNFTQKTDEFISGNTGKSYGQAWADFNKNGSLDVCIVTHSYQTDKVFCGNSGGNWLNVRLQGVSSNKSAIGAKVKIKADGKWQARQLYPINGLGSQNSLRLHFGVGQASGIDSLEIKWSSGYVQRIQNLYVNQFITITEETGHEVTGIVFKDQNNNCTQDSNEPAVANARLRIAPLDLVISTDQNGAFQTRLPAGNYTLQALNATNWEGICTHQITVGNGTNDVKVAYKPVTALYDLNVNMATTAWRRGFKNQTVLSCKNTGTATAYNVQVRAMYPNEVALLSSHTAYTTPQVNHYLWTLDSLRAGETRYISITDSVKLSASVGQNLQLACQIQANGTDANLHDNEQTQLVEIVGAIDPNDMLVSPVGNSSEGFIHKAQILTYTIRFQNVGTYEASRVELRNRIPAELDINTLQILEASHQYKVYIDAERILRVDFPHINLPDSTTNEPESHGFLRYSVKPLPTLPIGAKIYNQASIVFDYEAAIKTNQVLSTIAVDLDNRPKLLPVYPNPAQDKVTLMIEQPLQKIWVYDSKGTLLIEQNNPKATLDVQKLENGIYFIRGIDQFQMQYIGKLVVSK